MTLPSEERPERPGALPEPPMPPALPVHDTLDTTEPEAAATEKQPYTRIRAAWVGVWAGVVAVILLIVFVGQNTAPVRINFLWLDGAIPTALALLIAGVGGAVIAMAVAAARILQLRRTLRRDR
jgi:uncharacterized integral membrane protein